MSARLDLLVAELKRLDGPARLDQLTDLLRATEISCDDVAAWIRFDDKHYARQLVHGDEHFNVWLLCWKNGQRSPIHDHIGSNCAVRVLRGVATQTTFAFAANGHIVAIGSNDIRAGEVVASQDRDVHQISNLQPDSADLVTLHIYSPPLRKMNTYSLYDRSRGVDVWREERKIITSSPENSEMPLESMHGWVTPNHLFFVRNHFEIPEIQRDQWRLKVCGCVEQPREWTWEELDRLPQRSIFATVECAGNGRSFLTPKVHGVQWGAGAIGHAEWTGVPLCDVLNESGLRKEAVEILFRGADAGVESDHPERIHFERSLPLAKALHPDTLLVTRMNGELLTPNHGAPVRLFVPGWYGVASVKWLERIEAIDQPFRGYYQSKKYTYQERGFHGLQTVIIGPMAVKSEIIRPVHDARLGIGTNRIFGVAWAGEEAVERVELSTDGGRTWAVADLIGLKAPYSWTMWEYLWEVAEPGDYVLLSRAVSASGQVQPLQHNPLHGGYKIHFSRPTRVRIEKTQRSEEYRAAADVLFYDMNAFAEENARVPLDVELEFSGGEGI
ncbi:MAG: hypothetical protein KatS3mg105_4299 [Gemmatales bacterium]|nr:MAG: hypothetical protein KatS3mg105_4299 [Gemmatales bacterium]